MSRVPRAKGIYDAFNVIESKLARLSKFNILVGDLHVTYLSNVKQLNANKPILVLLHGFSGDKYVWNRVAKYFTSHYQLLIPDLKGHGDTAYHEGDSYTVPSQTHMLIQLLDKLSVDCFHVVGNSMGGMMAAKLIESIPKRIQKCVLIDPAGARSKFVIEGVIKNENPFDHCNEQDFFNFYRLLMAKPPYVPKFILRALAKDYVEKSPQHAKMFAQFYTIDDFFPPSHRFTFEHTMLIWGWNDKLLPIDDYQQWRNMLSGNTIIYEDLGHLPMIEDAKRVAKDILAFLKTPI